MQKIVTSLNVTIRLNQIGINDSELLNNFETNNDNIIILVNVYSISMAKQ